MCEHAFTNNLTLAINYVGNESHHLINSTNTGTGTARGYWSNQLNPIYLVGLGSATDSTGKQPLLTAPANAANVAKAQSLMPGINIPASIQAAASILPSTKADSNATIAQGLIAFPQYSGVSDTWGNVANFAYNSLQVTVQQRLAHGLTFNFNYTWARNVGDDGPYRTGFALPSGSVSGTTNSYKMNRIDRSETTVTTPNSIHAFGVWSMPFGRGHSLGSSNGFVSALVSGWQLSGIYTYASGTPVQITYAGCTTPLQGQCMPDVAPGFSPGTARQGGGYGSGPGGRTAANLGKVQYFNVNAFQKPVNINQTAGSDAPESDRQHASYGRLGTAQPIAVEHRCWPASQHPDLERDGLCLRGKRLQRPQPHTVLEPECGMGRWLYLIRSPSGAPPTSPAPLSLPVTSTSRCCLLALATLVAGAFLF